MFGKQFGKLTSIVRAGKKSKKSGYYWLCVCECGKICKRLTSQLNYSKGVQSCGCYINHLNKEKPKERESTNLKHGACSRGRTTEYVIWYSMIQRCTNKNHVNFSTYGGRGITVCEHWLKSFENFLADMGERPSKKHSLDRVDVNIGYSKDNCRWATSKQQANNKTTSVSVNINGIVFTIPEVSERYNIPERTLYRWRKLYNTETFNAKVSARVGQFEGHASSSTP